MASYTSSIFSTSFTPDFDGVVEVSATWMGAGDGSGLGQLRISRLYLTQGAATLYSTGVGIPKAGYVPFVDRFLFAVTAAAGVCTVGIKGYTDGAISINWKDIEITVRRVQ